MQTAIHSDANTDVLPFEKAIVILPTYNEIDNIESMLNSLHQLSPNLNVLVIDDNSPDKTADKVKDIQKKNPNIHIIVREKKLGLGTAYLEGFKFALKNKYDYIFEMDCDFSHDPGQLPSLLREALGHDLVIGSRYINGIRVVNWPILRLVLSYGASIYTRLITGMPIKDPTGGFKCFTRKALESLNFDHIFSNGYSFQIELNFKIWCQNLKIKEVPIIFYERRNGKSKMSKKIIFEAVWAVFRLRLKKIWGKLN